MLTKQLKSTVDLTRRMDTEENWIIDGDKIIWEVVLEYGRKEQERYDKCL